MFSYPIIPDNSEAQHSSISIYIPSAGRSFMLEFLLWSSKKHLVWCLPNSKVFLVICCSDFVFQERLSIWLILRGDQFIFENHGSWSDMLDALASWWIFSNNRRLPFRSRPVDHWTFLKWSDRCRQTLFTFCLCIILTWNPIDYLWLPFYLVVHQRIYCFCISSLCL